MTDNIVYLQNASQKSDVSQHFDNCDDSFISDIAIRTPVSEYIAKIVSKAHRFEAWNKDKLLGLVAVYINFEKGCGYITNVSVIIECYGLGIAKSLLSNCCKQLNKLGIEELSLEVKTSNSKAIYLYNKFGFIKKDEIDSYQVMNLNLKSREYDE